MKVSPREASVCVKRKQPFKGNSVFAVWIGDEEHPLKDRVRYVVYSYGTHYPLFVYEQATGQWFANMTKYSVTTSKHYSMLFPNVGNVIHLGTESMKALVYGGPVAAIAEKIEQDRKDVNFREIKSTMLLRQIP